MEMLGYWHEPILGYCMIRPTWLECADVYALQLVIYVDPTCGAIFASRRLGGRCLGPSHSVTHATMVDNLEGFFALCHCHQGTQHEPRTCWGTPPPRVVTCEPPGWGGLEHKHGDVNKHEERLWVATKP